ncbi:hypothetical protein E4U53_007148 [Claviceps sorghi]|nr:hypothetical protein E4U53_007148 [Claviceps sorghi]
MTLAEGPLLRKPTSRLSGRAAHADGHVNDAQEMDEWTPGEQQITWNSLRLRSEVAQLNDTCEAREEERGWRVDFDLGGCQGERNTLRDLFETEGLGRPAPSFGAGDTAVEPQNGNDDGDADWCCVGGGRDSLSPASTMEARHGHLPHQRELSDCASASADAHAGRQRPGRSSASGPARLAPSILFHISEDGGGAAENLPGRLQDADEMSCGLEVSMSSALSHLSRCPPDALASIKSSARSRTTALHDADFSLASPSQASSTTAGREYGSIRVPGRQSSPWEGSPNVRGDLMTSFPSIAASPGTDRPGSQGVSPLFQAAMAGNVNILSIMVHNSVFPEMVNEDGQTVLHVAARNGHCEEVEFLIGAGFDVNARDHLGNTALHLAIAHGWEKMVEVLVDAGADVDGLNYK